MPRVCQRQLPPARRSSPTPAAPIATRCARRTPRGRSGPTSTRCARTEEGVAKPGDERRQQQCVLQERPDRRGDQAGRGLRGDDSRRGHGRQDRLSRLTTRPWTAAGRTRPALSKPLATSPTTTARRRLSTSSRTCRRRTPSSQATATRSHTRSGRAASSTTRARSARRSPPATGPAARASTTASYSGSSPVWRPTRCRVPPTVCNDPAIKANAFIYYQCDHGLGHGLMLYTSYDLPDALDYCHQLLTEVRPGLPAAAASSWRTRTRRSASTRSG